MSGELILQLDKIWNDIDEPFLIGFDQNLTFKQVVSADRTHLNSINAGSVVALIGDFDEVSISNMLALIDRNVILVPLSPLTRDDHEYFFEACGVEYIIEGENVQARESKFSHPLVDELRGRNHGGLVLFSTGTTGRPKAILHDMTKFLEKFRTPRPSLVTLNFLLFDHIGGINTLLHTLFNRGVVVAPLSRSVDDVLKTIKNYEISVLPTTPTFLRLMLLSGSVPSEVPECLKVITYGTERMDQVTLSQLCDLLPNVDFRQTFGMSELGILRVKSKSRDSLFMKVGGEGVETKVIDGVLMIKSENRMMGYLNAESPFDKEGWYNTHDEVEVEGEFIKVVGRDSDVINVGGLKLMPSEVELVALDFENVVLAKAQGKENPVTGQHVELIIQTQENSKFDLGEFKAYLRARLQPHMVPRRVMIEDVTIGHRFKKL